jgi:hypothetical protein
MNKPDDKSIKAHVPLLEHLFGHNLLVLSKLIVFLMHTVVETSSPIYELVHFPQPVSKVILCNFEQLNVFERRSSANLFILSILPK